MTRSFLFTVVILLALVQSTRAQSFDPAVPSPAKVLGYELGDRYTSHAGVEKYLQAVNAAVPDRMKLIPYGATNEGRTLYLAIFSSPDNLKRLDAIKKTIHQLADPRTLSSKDVDNTIGDTPVIVWLSYGVHGNEASSPEAALDVVHQFAARLDDEMTNMLKNAVVIVDPLLNPDGHERYVNFEITHSGAKPVQDRNGVEHNEDWPSGRTNHYYFDLNRDWSWMTQKETRARVAAYQEWKPQVHVDYHEMGYNSSYFFFPAFKPVNKNFPKSTMTWGDIFGRANAAAFDAKGWNYWSGEEFDLFYPGYGDAWPSFNGAIGMTYEQAGQTGVRVLRSDETILTLRDRLEHHATTSLATVKAAADHRKQRLQDFYQFFADAISEGRSGSVRTYVVDGSTDPGRAEKMARLLRNEGIEVTRTDAELSASGLSTYFSSAQQSHTFPKGSYLIQTDQPGKRLLTALFEQEPALTDTFFYDISAWALPLAYGVPVHWSSKPLSVSSHAIADADTVAGAVDGHATSAYLLKWDSNNSIRALIALLQSGIKANVAMQSFTASGQQFGRGTIVIPVAGNSPDVHDVVQDVARKDRVHLYASNSGYTDHGINLGSDRMVRLKRPKIIVVTGQPVGTESYGAIWSMFDSQYDLQFVPMKVQQLRNADLHEYTAIIFPDDNSNGFGYKSVLDSAAVLKIKTWIRGGGTFVGIEGGASFASASVGKICSVKFKEKDKDKDGDKKDKDAKDGKLSEEELGKRMTVEQRERKSRLENIPGTMFRVKLDNSHPLGFGYDTTLAVLKTSSTMFELSEDGYNVGIYPEHARLSGYISAANEKRLSGTPFLVHEQMGAGNVVLFADDPNFRLFWDNLNMIFMNSILVLPGIRDVSAAAQGGN